MTHLGSVKQEQACVCVCVPFSQFESKGKASVVISHIALVLELLHTLRNN